MQTNFYLKRPDYSASGGDKPTAIYLALSTQGKRIKIPSGESIPTTAWNKDRQIVKPQYTGSVEINRYLQELSEQVLQVIRSLKTQGAVITAQAIRDHLQPLNSADATAEAAPVNFWEVFDQYISEAQRTKSRAVVQVYRSTWQHLRFFQEAKGYKIAFENITPRFYNQWLDYFYDREFVDNTVGKYVKTLKSFLHFATDRGHNHSLAFKKFKVLKHDVDIVYLEPAELQALQALNLTNKPYLANARDLFLLACYTGLRFSDLSQLDQQHYRGEYLQMTSRKTRQQLKIPIVHPYARDILNRYFSGDLHTITNQKMNVYVKELAQMAGLDEICEVTQFRGSKRISRAVPKYALISSHTGRRTFVTQSLERGMRPEVVMQITGHKDYKSFNKYIKVTDRQKVVEMKKAWQEAVLNVS